MIQITIPEMDVKGGTDMNLIGRNDSKGEALYEGDTVVLQFIGFNGEPITYERGVIEYKSDDISSWGAGYGVQSGRRFTYLACVSHDAIIQKVENDELF